MNSMADKLKNKGLSDTEINTCHEFYQELKLYQKIEPANAYINNLVAKIEGW